ncbi:MAG TPA: hypothetical protein VHX37_05530 [Acidobacteriaceae bacterium]|nr:hypothetical protein [Acidobacteriaceae bacterium]
MRYCAERLVLEWATVRGVPVTTTLPSSSPVPGPMSMSQALAQLEAMVGAA